MMTLNMLAAAIILLRGLIALNHMCPGTALAMRAAWLLITAGAGASMLLSAAPTWPDVAIHCGLAALLCASRKHPFFERPTCR